MFKPPVAYQGGKTRIADEIVRLLSRETIWPGSKFYDLCCGCGAVSIALVRAGVDPRRIVMVDIGPWGVFWSLVGSGGIDLARLRRVIDAIPKDPKKIQAHMDELAHAPLDEDRVYVFLVLQAASFGGKPIWVKNDRWRVHGFRSFWTPTATSSQRSHVNPMMPMPETLYSRVEELSRGMRGVTGLQRDVREVAAEIPRGSLVYVDPPYAGLTGYATNFDVVELAHGLARRRSTVLVSEARALGPEATLVAAGRKKGGVSAGRAQANEEWVTIFTPNG